MASSRAGQKHEILLRAVALTAEAQARTGVTSWDMKLEADCRAGQVRLGATTGYSARQPDGDGDGVPLAPAEAEWRRPKPGTVLEAAWRATCDPAFRPPLSQAKVRLAEAPARPAATPPPPAAPAASTFAREVVASAPARSTSKAAVQVVSSPQEADTRRALKALQEGDRLQGLQPRIEPARVRGQTVYRGLIAGFASRAEAQAFCTQLIRRGHDCLTR